MSISMFAIFTSALLAATILPLSSEVLLVGALANDSVNHWTLWATATAGNTVGAVINWGLGRFGTRYQDRKWFPASQQQIEEARKKFHRYGLWSLLLAWLPVAGEAITILAGLLRVRIFVFVVLVAIGKGARYAAVVAGVDFLLF